MPPCAFCPNPATTKRGEHVFDNWLNRKDGRHIEQDYTVIETGPNGQLLRTFGSRSINVTKSVVCDQCNHGWMSDVTNATKTTAEGFIRHRRPATLLPIGLATIASFAFMKAAVVDFDSKSGFFSPQLRTQF